MQSINNCGGCNMEILRVYNNNVAAVLQKW